MLLSAMTDLVKSQGLDFTDDQVLEYAKANGIECVDDRKAPGSLGDVLGQFAAMSSTTLDVNQGQVYNPEMSIDADGNVHIIIKPGFQYQGKHYTGRKTKGGNTSHSTSYGVDGNKAGWIAIDKYVIQYALMTNSKA